MSVLIKGFNLKPCKDGFDGKGLVIIGYDEKLYAVAHEQIIPLPDHGDLIEREYAIASACSGRIRALPTTEDGEDWIRVEEVRQSLKSVPTVIPAERSEE